MSWSTSRALLSSLVRPAAQNRFLSTTNVKKCDSVEISSSPVLVEKNKEFKVMTISLNRGSKRNCVNKETAEKLYEAFEDFESDKDLNVAILHGIGGNFCAGYDLDELAKLDRENIANEIASMMIDRGPMGPTRMELTKPVIASITGYCVAGGLELALMCDLRVMEENAKMGVLNRRFGVPLIDGGSVRLPELIGLSRALDLIITGRLVESKEALQMGLVSRLAKVGAGYGLSMQLAAEIAKVPQECMRVDRASAYHATFASKSLEESLQYESENAVHIISTESIEGAQKFALKGLGRHGKFNVTQVSKEDWEIEREELMKEASANENDKEKMG